MRTFVALKTFHSPETKSMYVEGLSYTIKQGNRYLNALAEVWALEEKIRFAHNMTKCVLTGIGHVCEAPPPPPPVVTWAPAVMEPVIVHDQPVDMVIDEVVEQYEEPVREPELTYWEMTKKAWNRLWQ